MRRFLFFTIVGIQLLTASALHAEDGYRLWLRYDLIKDQQKLADYKRLLKTVSVEGESPTISVARKELRTGLAGLLGDTLAFANRSTDGMLLAGTLSSSPRIAALHFADRLKNSGNEGFLITSAMIDGHSAIVICANTDAGVLYGIFHFLRLIQTNSSIHDLSVMSSPAVKIRVLNHWDNLDRTVERGYAGFSIWDWETLPEYIDPRYIDYARANASIGINGAVLTNVNSNAWILSSQYLIKVAALADAFRPYHIKVYLSARFSAPIESGDLKTSDPLDPLVRKWWQEKAKELYGFIPDFGGFIVKANSEGQPGPQNYGRTHADGANMLAEAVDPFGGIIMWRAFVYDNNVPEDRTKQAYNEFKPLDGKFKKNVLIQVKNGPLDFQPREPFHPLFGAMPASQIMPEFQITQEYLGQGTHLVYLAPLFKECLDADTFQKGKGSMVSRVVDGSLNGQSLTGMAGVANIGTDRNWCGHPFGQANWFAFGRLAWDLSLQPDAIANEWIRMTFTSDEPAIQTIQAIMMNSREVAVRYMTPMGLHHIMGWNHHYGPGPWVANKQRADWTAVYYHRADSAGVGFDRTSVGSNAIGQYAVPVQKLYESASTCPEKFLLWFHHVSWNLKTSDGSTLWNRLCTEYQHGVDSVRWMQRAWHSVKSQIDDERFRHVEMLLAIQEKDAVSWRNSCTLYFQTFSHLPIPPNVEKSDHPLDYYVKQEFPFSPGIRPKW